MSGDKDAQMIVGEKGVAYGLQIRGKQVASRSTNAEKPLKRSVFGDEEDESEDDDLGKGYDRRMVGQMIVQQSHAAKNDRKVLEIQAEALKQDANIFDYDAHVDSIHEARSKSSSKTIHEKIERRSKYITGLLETAEHRKREQEVLKEKRMEKERAAEEQVYGTKERFVTSAYRKKMEEEQKWKEEQEKKKKEEDENAVEKKGHMGDFYRNFFKSNVDLIQNETVNKPGILIEDTGNDRITLDPQELAKNTSSIDNTKSVEPPEEPLQQRVEDAASRAERLKRERQEKIEEAKQRYLARKKGKK